MSLPTASYSQILPPTSPSHAIACQLAPSGHHLVTARDDTLQVWEVSSSSSSSSSSSPRLIHLLTKPFFGTITGLLSTSTLESEQDGCDRLLVSFRDAKLALLEWNERAEDLETVSIHTYERTPQVAAGLGPHFRPILSKDPEGRCATLLLPQDSLAVLPLISSSDLALLDDESDDDDNIYGGGGPSYSHDNDNARRPPYTPSFVLPLSEVDVDIRNVRDVVFLPSFQKPTCAVLCEPHQPAWTGSLATRRDTLHVYIFTLDLTSTTHPVLSHVEELPYDALYLVAGPPSLGGVFVVTPSVLFHVDQSGRMVGVRVNGWAEMTSANKEVLGMPLYDGGEQLDLCDSHIAWVEGMDVPLVDVGTRAKPPPGSGLLVLKDGRVMSLRCELDGRTLSSLSLQSVSIEAELPLPSPSAVVTLEHSNSIFVASMLGESSLVGVKAERLVKEKGEDDEMDSKPSQQQQSAGMDLDDEDEDLYGDSKPEASTCAAAAASSSSNTHLSYTLTPLDSMPGLGPISDLTLAVLPDEADSSSTDIIKLVATHGVEPHAGLVHFEDVVQPRGRRAVHLHDANSGGREGMAIPALDDVKRVARGRFLGINPLVGTPTLYAIDGEGRAEVLMEFFEGNVKAVGWLGVDEATGNERYLIVAQDAVFVRSTGQDGDEEEARTSLAGTAKQVVLGLDEQSGAVNTIAARLDDGRVQVFVVDATGGVHQIALLDDQDYLRVALFVDESGTFSSPSTAAPISSGSTSRSRPQVNAADDEDEVDYGDEDMQPASTSAPSAAVPEASHHLAVITSSGGLELFILSTSQGAQRAWRSNSILDLPAQLEPLEDDEPVITCSEAVDVEADVDDLWIGVLGEQDDNASCATLCIAMTERSGLLNVWTAAASNKPASTSPLIFNKKLARQLDSQEEDGSRGGADDYGAALPPNGEITARIPHRIVAMQGAGRAGGRRLFVTGPAKTGWLVNPRKGKLHFFESAHRRVRGLAVFSSHLDEDEEEHGAATSTATARYIIADTHGLALHTFPPPTLRFDLPLPYTLLTTTHRQYTHIRPYPPLRSLVTSSISRTQFVQFDTEDMSIVRPLEFDPSPAYSTRGALELFRGDFTEPVDGFEFEQNETVSAMELVTLHSASSATGLKDFIAVGTSVFNGEDRPTRGAMYIFDVIETVPNPNDPTPGTNARLKLLVKDDARGPVTALTSISGYLAVSIGQRLFIRAFEKHEVLINVAFLDVGFLSTSLRRLGSTLLISDVRRAVLFAGFQEEPFRLTIFGRQFPGVEGEQAGGGYVCAAEYLVSEGGLNFLAADWRGVLRLLEYPAAKAVAEASDAANAGAGAQAQAAAAGGGGSAGSRLLLRTEFQTSATEFTASLSRAPRELLYGAAAAVAATGEDAAGASSSSSATSLALRNEVLLSTSSGSLVMVRPLSTAAHAHAASSAAAANAAASLSNAMQRSIPHSAALPPRGARIVPNKASVAARPLNRGLLDGGVLQGEWLEGCSRVKREELAGIVRATGTKGGGESEGQEGEGSGDGDGRGEERLRRSVADLFS